MRDFIKTDKPISNIYTLIHSVNEGGALPVSIVSKKNKNCLNQLVRKWRPAGKYCAPPGARKIHDYNLWVPVITFSPTPRLRRPLHPHNRGSSNHLFSVRSMYSVYAELKKSIAYVVTKQQQQSGRLENGGFSEDGVYCNGNVNRATFRRVAARATQPEPRGSTRACPSSTAPSPRRQSRRTGPTRRLPPRTTRP